jgi:hypothetical protein
MRLRLAAVTVAATVGCGLFSAAAQAGTATQPKLPKPSWYTAELHERIVAAGAQGVAVGEERLNIECPGVATRGVSANGCIVAPAGCTANFIFGGPGNYHIGTARHCVNGVGNELVMQVDTATLASVGTVVKHTPGEGVPGNDFALIRLDPGVVAKWGVSPAIPVVGGPQGVYSGCGPQAVLHYGHGYGVAVAQGKPSGGLATNWNDDGYGWTGFGIMGDSGSGVITSTGQAAGNFTHLIVNPGQYPGSNLAGMRATRMIQVAGMPIVNANGTQSGSPTSNCGAGGL